MSENIPKNSLTIAADPRRVMMSLVAVLEPIPIRTLFKSEPVNLVCRSVEKQQGFYEICKNEEERGIGGFEFCKVGFGSVKN